MKKGSGKWAGSVCCICGEPFKCAFDGKPYCNKHWLRLYNNGTTDKCERKRTNQYEIKDDILIITTAKGARILADASDYDLISKYSWCVSKTGYPVANINAKVTKMHRYLLGRLCEGKIVDHINGNVFDNRRCNLRICKTAAENARNCGLSKNNKSGCSGVQFIKKTRKYRSRITVNRKEINLGHFDSYDDAVKARIAAEKKYFGDYAPSVCRAKREVTP